MVDRSRPHELTPRQIAWCCQHIAAFADAWRAVQAANAHRAEARGQVGRAAGRLATEQPNTGANPSPRTPVRAAGRSRIQLAGSPAFNDPERTVRPRSQMLR